MDASGNVLGPSTTPPAPCISCRTAPPRPKPTYAWVTVGHQMGGAPGGGDMRWTMTGIQYHNTATPSPMARGLGRCDLPQQQQRPGAKRHPDRPGAAHRRDPGFAEAILEGLDALHPGGSYVDRQGCSTATRTRRPAPASRRGPSTTATGWRCWPTGRPGQGAQPSLHPWPPRSAPVGG